MPLNLNVGYPVVDDRLVRRLQHRFHFDILRKVRIQNSFSAVLILRVLELLLNF